MFNLFKQLKRWNLSRKGFAGTDKLRRKESPSPVRSSRWRIRAVRLTVLLLVWLAASLSVIYRRSYSYYNFVVGQTVERHVYSEIHFEHEDTQLTLKRREEAARKVQPIFRIADHLEAETNSALAALRNLFLEQDRKTGEPPAEAGDDPPPGDVLDTTFVDGIDPGYKNALESIFVTPERWALLQSILVKELRQGIIAENELKTLSDERESIQVLDPQGGFKLVSLSALRSPEEAALQISQQAVEAFPENAALVEEGLRLLLSRILRPNLDYDIRETQQARRKAADSVPAVSKRIPAGVILVRPDTKISAEDLMILEQHRQALQQSRALQVDVTDILPASLLCLLAILGAAYFLRLARPNIFNSDSLLLLTGLVIILHLWAIRLVTDFFYLHWSSTVYLYSVLPFAFGALLLTQLIGVRAGIICTTLTSLIVALQITGLKNEHFPQVFLVSICSGFIGAVMIRKALNRSHGIRAGLAVGIIVFLIQSMFWMQQQLPQSTLIDIMPKAFGISLGSGVLSAILVSTLLVPFFEYVFGITTDITLLELSDLNHPLLKRLQMEAPGTYHHSLMVAALAEQAAEAIGANPLMARVCAYFHDIGKLSYPYYFSENITGQDPHQDLQPRMSGLVILNHVKEGIDLALKCKMKKPIREAIAQHHGTTLVYYFYRRAVEQTSGKNGDRRVREQEFRYPGPLPSRREIALISIADSCEAAARAMEKPTHQKISDLVDEIVLKRIREGQFEEAGLTFKDLTIAKRVIAKTLMTMQHGRIKYPKDPDDENDLFKAAAKAAADKPAQAGAGNPSSTSGERAAAETAS